MSVTDIATTPSLTRPADTVGRPLATWSVRYPWLVALGVALGGVLLTAVGAAVGQVAGLAEGPALWVQAAAVALSAVIGVLIMGRHGGPTDYGFRSPVASRAVLWGVPLVVLVGLGFLPDGVTAPIALVAPYVVLCVAVGFNEEIWFRGLLMAALRGRGRRAAILGSAVLFGVLHLANALAGSSPVYLALQVVFAFAVGLVLAQIVTVTGSLWIGIVWHALYDIASMLAGDSIAPAALIALGVACVILAGMAVVLSRYPTADGR